MRERTHPDPDADFIYYILRQILRRVSCEIEFLFCKNKFWLLFHLISFTFSVQLHFRALLILAKTLR